MSEDDPTPPLTAAASLAETAAAHRAGDGSLEAALAAAEDRFAEIEPHVQALLPEEGRWARIDDAATALLDRYPDPGRRPPLFGGLVGVKDIFHAAGFPTRAGSSIPPEVLRGHEASTVTSLFEAGALVLGKTVTTEFAFYDPGPTRNPHDLGHTPGGSSSGSAAAVAAGLCPLALGSQTIGSVTRPAAFCGIVGVKPSYGRLPMDGVIPVAPSVDHVGYFTQDLPSARLAASVLYPDWGPVPTVEVPRLAAVEGPYLDQAEGAAVDAFERQVTQLEAVGHEVTRLTAFPDVDAVNERHHRLVAAETALSHDEWYPAYGDGYGPKLRTLIEEGLAVSAGELAAARSGRGDLREHLDDAMVDEGVDVVLSPSAPGPAPAGLDSTGDPVMNLPWTHSGLPTVSLPVDTLDGLPLGLQCAGRYGFDEWLLGWADAVVDALDA